MRRALVALSCLVMSLPAWGAPAVSGSIKTVAGRCEVRSARGVEPARVGAHLLEQDVLSCGADGHMGVIMRDGTRLSLGPNTELKIEQFVYDPSHSKFSLLLDMTKGMLAYVSGKIASFSPEAVRVQTPVGAIGLRGTRFVVGLGVPEGKP